MSASEICSHRHLLDHRAQGYLIGNGVTDPQFDGNALVPFARGKSLISESLFLSLHRECKGNFYSPQGML